MVSTRANREFLIKHQVILIFSPEDVFIFGRDLALYHTNAFGSNIIENKNTCICRGVCTLDSVDRLGHSGPGFKFGLLPMR